MNNSRTNSIFSLLVVLLIAGGTTMHAQSIWASAYYAGWQQGYNNSGYMPTQDVDFSAVTHIIHFAAVPQANGTLDDASNSVTAFNANALVTAAHAAGKKVIICIGGWGSESNFMSATSPATLSTFVSNIVSFMKTRGYDGVDIDWEAINPSDDAQYTTFITSLRTALDAVSPRPLLCAATAWEPSLFASLAGKFDQINLMTYDLAGAWPGWVSWPNSPVSDGGFVFPSTGAAPPSADGMVGQYVAAGVPANKLGIGVDFYGYVWSGGAGTPTGGVTAPRQSWTTAPSVQSNVPYSTIMDTYYQSQYYKWDAGTQSAYLSIDNTGSANDQYITYDDQTTIQSKVNYAKTKGIGGLIVWELGGGYRANQPVGQQDVLLQSLKQALGGSTTTADVTPPTVSITSPANGAVVSAVVTLSANATDNAGVVGVQFQVDGVNSGTEVTTSPYSVSVNTASLTNAGHTFSATARDAAGNKATASVTITVSNALADVTPPTVAIASPANGSTVSGSVSLSATASDNVGVVGVQFALDGTNLGTEITASPYTASWNTAAVTNGTHTLSATARDAAGNKSTASSSVVVSNTTVVTSSDLVVYSGGLQTPWNNNSWSASVTFNSADQLYAGTSSIKTALTSAWGALSLHDGSWGTGSGVSSSLYTSLSFVVYAPTTGTALTVYAENDAGQTFPQINYGTVAVNQWVTVSIPMSQLDPSGYLIQRISLQEVSGTTKTFYVNNLRFVGTATTTLPSVPVLVGPGNGATGIPTNSSLTWNSSTGASSYRVQLSSDSAFGATNLDQSGLTSTSCAVSSLKDSTNYYWRVNASNSSGHSAWSTVSRFTTVTAQSTPSTSASLWVYQDVLPSPWINASWNAAITFASTDRAYAGTSSIKVAQNAWGALRVHDGAWGSPVTINTSLYQSFQFVAYGGTTGLTLSVYFENDSNSKFPAVGNIAVPANQWSVVSLPVSLLNPNNYAVTQIIVQDVSGLARTYYLDNICFSTVPAASANSNPLKTLATSSAPTSFALGQNFPNPFNPSTVIAYSLPQAAHMSVDVYNVIGQQVASLVDAEQSAGDYRITFDASKLASGVYFYRVTARSLGESQILFSATRKMMLAK